ncbi:MAG: hypothetical protein IKQ15_02710 [Kiritimatiellae bacterium]|nr:hypothetical protein [Kiritimatiellia bacterium]
MPNIAASTDTQSWKFSWNTAPDSPRIRWISRVALAFALRTHQPSGCPLPGAIATTPWKWSGITAHSRSEICGHSSPIFLQAASSASPQDESTVR